MSDADRARLEVVERELFGNAFTAGSHILSANAGEIARQANEHRAALARERQELLSRLPQPVTGERAGHLVIASTLGTVYVRETEPEPEDLGFDPSNPFERFAHEMGWSIE